MRVAKRHQGFPCRRAITVHKATFAELTEEYRRRIPVVEPGPPAFCAFADMNWFESVLTLEGSGVTPVYGARREAVGKDRSVTEGAR